jgi:hypothetical protein
MHKDNDFGDTENILDLPADVLKKRTIQKLDICVDKLEDKEQRADCDTTKYHSELSGLGPLQPGSFERPSSRFLCVCCLFSDTQTPSLAQAGNKKLSTLCVPTNWLR